MKKKFLLVIIGIGLLLAVASGIYFIKPPGDKANLPEKNDNLLRIVDVDEVVKYPDHFNGSIEVIGKVIKVEESKTAFVLGCEDECIMMPVKYKGQMPQVGEQISVFGEIKKAEGEKYFFEAQEVKSK